MKASTLLGGLGLFLVGGTAHGARLDVADATASSNFPEENGIRYAPAQGADGKLSTAWVEGEEGSGLGSWIELDLGGEQNVHKVKIWAGLWYSREYWGRANRPKEVELRFSDGSSETFELTDEMEVQELQLASPTKTSSVRIRVKQIYSGNTWLDTAISEVQVFDASPGEYAAVRKSESSSQLASDADGSYDPSNLYDGLNDSMWCEGDDEGDGVGEWLELTFSGQRDVSSLHLVNGIGTGLKYWMKANRATSATLTFSDGATETVTLRNTMLPQDVTFPTHATSSVRITFDEVARGKEYNDLCVSEAYFK